jgi:hypothetical protein
MTRVKYLENCQYILPKEAVLYLQSNLEQELYFTKKNTQLHIQIQMQTWPLLCIPFEQSTSGVLGGVHPHFFIDYQEYTDICIEAYSLRTTIQISFYNNPRLYTFQGEEHNIKWSVTSVNPRLSPQPTCIKTFTITTADLKRLEAYIDNTELCISVSGAGCLIVTQHNCHLILSSFLNNV